MRHDMGTETGTDTYAERLRHVFYEEDGFRWCVICDEEWPCPIRRGETRAEDESE